MFSARNGFILSDALVSVLVVSMTAVMVTGAAVLSVHHQEAVEQTFVQMEERYEMGFLNEPVCECEEENETDPY